MTLAAHLLTLPSIRRVPIALSFTRGIDAPSLRIAQLMAELGIVAPGDLKPPFGDPQAIIEAGLEHWARSITGPLRYFDGAQVFIKPHGVAEWVGQLQTVGSLPGDIDPKNSAIFGFAPWEEPRVVGLREVCEPLHKAHPLVAEHAVHALAFAARRGLFCLMPDFARDYASMIYGWDEVDDEDPDRMTEADFDRHVPLWVSQPKRRLTHRKLRDYGHPVAQATVEVEEAMRRCHFDLGLEGLWQAGVAVAFHWDVDEPLLGDLYDNYVNDCHNGGDATEDYSAHIVEITKPTMARWFTEAAQFLNVIKHADRLVTLLVEGTGLAGLHAIRSDR